MIRTVAVVSATSALHIVISEHDDSDITAVTSTLIETATVLPNTRQFIDEEGARVLHIAQGDLEHYPELAEKIRRLTHEYERLLEEQESSST